MSQQTDRSAQEKRTEGLRAEGLRIHAGYLGPDAQAALLAALREVIAAAPLYTARMPKSGRPMYLRLAEEFMAAFRREGEAMSKREQTIKMAEANKAFSHFAW